ncbi:MAG TPA: adenosine deaminase [Magnetospirillaceae bacterium]|jgi:adenosine deaminase
MTIATPDFIAGLPKAELHLHIEGTLTRDLKRKLAARNKIDLGEKTFTALEVSGTAASGSNRAMDQQQLGIAQYKMFLDLYYEGLKVLHTEEDFRDLIFAYLESCKADNILYSEIMFDPQAHTDRGVSMGVVMEGLIQGRKDAAEQLGVESNLIMCINRDRSADSAMQMIDDAQPWRDHIAGLGLDSVEDGHPPVKFKDHYARAKSEGYRLTAHCDVDMVDAVKHLWQCIDVLGVERVDHGINTIEDERLIAAMKEREMCFTTCPTWRTGDPKPRRVDRIRIMHELGLKVTINTDDPGYFASGLMNHMLGPVVTEGQFTKDELAQFMINAFESAWLPKETRERYVGMVRGYVAS